MEIKKIPSFLFLVELSEKYDDPFTTEESEDFLFSYKVTIDPRLVELMHCGKKSVMYLEEETLSNLGSVESLEEYKKSLLEIIDDQLHLGPFVIFTTHDIIVELREILIEDFLYKNRFEIFPLKPDNSSLYALVEYHIGIPSGFTDRYYKKDNYRVMFVTQFNEVKLIA